MELKVRTITDIFGVGYSMHYATMQIAPDNKITQVGINLIDSKGKDAYVGDIFEDGVGIRRTIFPVSGGFACESNPVAFGFNSENRPCNVYSSLSDMQNAIWFTDSCTIIGNIIDNPELLKN